MKKKILYGVILLLLIITCPSCKNKNKDNNVPGVDPVVTPISNSQKLQILKSDLKLTQEQVMSRIKAENIKKNNGYLDTDEIITMVTLDGESLIESYNNRYSVLYKTVSEYANSATGIKQASKIKEEQDLLVEELKGKGLITEVEYYYSTIINAIAVKTTYGNFKEIGNLASVKSTILSDTYNLPQSISGDASAIVNLVDVYETGIFDSSSVSYKGAGTVVAVLDSGFDCTHTVFQKQPTEQVITDRDISSILGNMNASKFTKGLELKDVYYSRKIPFVYDYADKDSDVFPYDSEHGTHVAGIIGGLDDKITGVAVDTQLVLMKVFPDLSEGGKTEDILAALEDAVLLGVDAINMSLGSSCGFAREEDGNKINEVYERINESGISLITAASNSYSSGYGGEQGNTNFVTNPDSGTVGSPSTYDAALSVASISGVKSRYIIANGEQVLFYKESNSVTAKPNDFMNELVNSLPLEQQEKYRNGEKLTFEYVTIPGVGKEVNYANVGDITGKIALVRRGDNSFEEKAMIAKNKGAIACIIYNNIDGDILMSMGKTEHIPTISISKDDGTILASKNTGTLTIRSTYQAGPFMSDFSSWGPTPSLGIKPEITAHGGEIMSAIPGGGYDKLSGTSMATPNLCGIVVLIRQYIKEKYPTLSAKQVAVMTNQLLMSTANIVLDERGNPYSPRKQGAGLASLYNSVNTKAYITVDGIDRSKLELKDDAKRTGIYNMEFNLINLSNETLTYDLSVVGMTESVSTSDEKHVAEKSQILNGNTVISSVEGAKLNGTTLTIEANKTAKIKLTYNLSDTDKNLIDELFPYGMYVEGFVKLTTNKDDEIDLNIPFLAFYGDWTEAPMFDKTYFEVESEAHNMAIDDEDKIKADYYATTPYGSYFYNYLIPLGTYLYDIDEEKYDAIPASLDHIAISNSLGTIDGISAIATGLLRNARKMVFTITDKVTGEVVWEYIDYNASKAYPNGASPLPYYENLKAKSSTLGLVNNRQYEFKMKGTLDYGDGGESTNVRNQFSFDFYLDDEAPVLKEVSYEKVYDKTLKKDRYYINMVVYDNQYVQSIAPIIFTSSSTYTFLTKDPIPVYSEKGKDNVVRFEITDYLDDIFNDELITNALAFSIDDYALNSNIYLCQLPGTQGDFKFTKDGTLEGTDLTILSMYEDEVLDLTKYLATADTTVDDNKDYLKFLEWASSNEQVATIKEGLVYGLNAGRTTITVREALNGKQTVLIVNVKKRTQTKESLAYKPQSVSRSSNKETSEGSKAAIESIRFSYFDTLFAYSRAAQTSEIGKTGDRKFLSSMSGISFYPGEKIKLAYDVNPWYVEGNYNISYSSTNPSVAQVNENGEVTALKEGNANILIKVEGSNVMDRVRVTVKSEFVIENRMLVAYKGLGGDVVIPDDEGILYIGAYAFCLYDTDQSIELTDDDYDANKIPSMNTSVKSIVIPDGVEEIQKYAFYNCTSLERVVIPSSVKYIREYAFCKDEELTTINLENIQVIGKQAFEDCVLLDNISLNKIYAIGVSAFEGCTSLSKIDLSTLRNTGERAFKDCTNLKQVTLSENTKLASAMFVNTGIETIDIYEKVQIPTFCFAQCEKLQTVNIHNNLIVISKGAFSECHSLKNVNFIGEVKEIGEQAFYECSSIQKIVLPNNQVTLGNYCFYRCESLTEVEFQSNTEIVENLGSVFQNTNLTTFIVSPKNTKYTTVDGLLLDKLGTTIVFAATAKAYGDLVLDEKYVAIADSAFCGANITTLTVLNSKLRIGNYAFVNCENLEKVILPAKAGVVIGNHAFNYASSLVGVENLVYVKEIGDYAFANTGSLKVELGANANVGEGAFFQSKIVYVKLGANSNFGLGAFQKCSYLEEVAMPEAGNIHFGVACFANDIKLSKIDLSKLDETIERETFYGCVSLKSANLLTVKTIGDYSFADCKSLNYLNIPVVEVIGSGAFSKYSESASSSAPTFTSVTLPDTLKEIGEGAFLGCSGLIEITLPATLEEVNNYMFAYCINLQEVTLPATIKKIGLFSFAGCVLLSKINLDNIEEIANYAFTSCNVLDNVNLSKVKTIGEGAFAQTYTSGILDLSELVELGNYAFQGTRFEKVNAPKLIKIGEGAFSNNASLAEFTFANGIELVGPYAFNGCTNLKSFYFVDSSNTRTNDGTINDYAKISNGVLYTHMKSNHWLLSSVPANLDIEKLVIDEDTYRIESFAGNANTHIKELVLPDTLKIIGNYAFFGYTSLATVEFRSFIAPSLEANYNKNAQLTEDDPGYEILHKYFDVFGLELYYYNFIDLVGKKAPIKMILPKNSGLIGYDSIVYEVYFGKDSEANHSDYEAMNKSLIQFIDYAEQIGKLNVITLSDETLINNAITVLNSVNQDATKYGYSETEWNNLVKIAKDAKEKLAKLKLASASKNVRELQEKINNLPTTFDISKITLLRSISEELSNLTFENRSILDLTNYNTLVASYEEYVNAINDEAVKVVNSTNKAFTPWNIIGLVTTSLATMAFAYFGIRRKYM